MNPAFLFRPSPQARYQLQPSAESTSIIIQLAEGLPLQGYPSIRILLAISIYSPHGPGQPTLPTHRTLPLRRILLDPLYNAMLYLISFVQPSYLELPNHMEVMSAFAGDYSNCLVVEGEGGKGGTYADCNHLLDIYKLDRCRRSVLDRFRRRRRRVCPIAMLLPHSTS
jgi:hypothetical protein